MLLGKFRIHGHSMEPFLKNGQAILASSLPYLFSEPKVGDVVLFNSNDRILIKRIEKIGKKEVILKGDNKIDSLDVGKINKKEIIGKFIIKI